MIYLRRLPRVLGMLAVASCLCAIGTAVFLVNVIVAGFTSETWHEALDRTKPEPERVR